MKIVYTPKKNKLSYIVTSTSKYESKADRDFKKKKRSEITTLMTEIERREAENYHLN